MDQAKKLLAISKNNLAIYFSAAILMLLTRNIFFLLDYLKSGSLAVKATFSSVEVLSFSDGSLLGNLTKTFSLELVWALIGAAIYIIIWLALRIIADVRNEVILVRDYTHPSNFTFHKYLVNLLCHLAIRLVGITLLLFVGISLILLTLPFASLEFRLAIYSPSDLVRWLSFVGSMLLIIVQFHVLTFSLRLVRQSFKA